MQHRTGLTVAEQKTVKIAAGQILAHSILKSSERSTRLFRYLLDRALSDDEDALKERRIGHEVFGREAGYDTAEDPIVRNAASDLRKRLRQYDADNGPTLLLHILLAPGTYILSFRFPETESVVQQLGEVPKGVVQVAVTVPSKAQPAHSTFESSRTSKLPLWIAAIAVLACVFFVVAFFWERRQVENTKAGAVAANPLWKPMIGSGKEVFICLGHAQPFENEQSAVEIGSAGLQRITITDLKAYTNISGFLQIHSQDFQMRTDNQTTLLDLRDRPTVLIGIGNNQWAQRLTDTQRFHFDFTEADQKNPDRAVTIVDAAHPETKEWRVPLSHFETAQVDYAIAGRLLDPITGGIILYVAGAGAVGTQAASEYVTQNKFLRDMPTALENPRTNFQVVLRTPIVAGVPGTPVVIATNID